MFKFSLLVVLCVVAAQAWSQPDAVKDCRDSYGSDTDAHIACLERALQARQQPAADAVDVAGARPEPEPSASDDPPTGLGAEQVQPANRQEVAEDDSAAVRIVEARYDAKGLGTFRMADGQVWRETSVSAERRRLDHDKEYDARIERSVLGGYRLYVDGVRRMTTVRRVE